MVKFFTPLVKWHCDELVPERIAQKLGDVGPVLSIDFHPKHENIILASAGNDKTVRIWKIQPKLQGNDFSVDTDFLASIKVEHPVNVVRWSPKGDLLACATDGGSIYILTKSQETEFSSPAFGMQEDEEGVNKESWKVVKLFRGSSESIYELSWSPDSTCILFGSISHVAAVLDISTGKRQDLRDHDHYVQGVSWDPRDEYLITQSSDRSVCIYGRRSNRRSEWVKRHKLSKLTQYVQIDKEGTDITPTQESTPVKVSMFLDEIPSFFRRPNWSPDGNFFFAPCGIYTPPDKQASLVQDTTYLFSRNNIDQPLAHFPSPDKHSIVVKCHPLFFKNREGSKIFDLSYRMVFAIATLESISFYDTQLHNPICILTDIHYASLTDLSWSKDGKILAASSMDGFITFVLFDLESDLGGVLSEEETNAVKEAIKVEQQLTSKKSNKRKRNDEDTELPNKKQKLEDGGRDSPPRALSESKEESSYIDDSSSGVEIIMPSKPDVQNFIASAPVRVPEKMESLLDRKTENLDSNRTVIDLTQNTIKKRITPQLITTAPPMKIIPEKHSPEKVTKLTVSPFRGPINQEHTSDGTIPKPQIEIKLSPPAQRHNQEVNKGT